MLKVKNLQVSAGEQQIIKGVDLEVQPGELHVLMGPNGSGKSTLAQVVAGAPQFKVHPSTSLRASSSPITFEGKDLTKLTPDKRAKLGIFLGFQHLNEGFSGGEKKRNEILQMMALSPKLAILDEIDSGLDVDGLKLIAKAIKQFTVNSSQSSVILITHYARILKYLKPDFVHVMVDGRIVKSGKMSLAKKIEEKGYQGWQMV
ncbi:ABC transporter ATP-binding protein [Candidatus Curtissbacteria bacterium]|nr:ABC transporter ATP-binding protein [Candidatus Curtissbacteria bacterium]